MSELPERVMMKKQGRIVVPKPIREKLGLKEGSLLELKIYSNDKVLLTVLVK